MGEAVGSAEGERVGVGLRVAKDGLPVEAAMVVGKVLGNTVGIEIGAVEGKIEGATVRGLVVGVCVGVALGDAAGTEVLGAVVEGPVVVGPAVIGKEVGVEVEGALVGAGVGHGAQLPGPYSCSLEGRAEPRGDVGDGHSAAAKQAKEPAADGEQEAEGQAPPGWQTGDPTKQAAHCDRGAGAGGKLQMVGGEQRLLIAA